MSYAAGKSYAPGNIEWLYPHEFAPPRGQKIHILQQGCVSIQGVWAEDTGHMAWQRMFDRNTTKEQEYSEFLLMRKRNKCLMN